MDVNAPRPRSRGQATRQTQEHGSVPRKVFNCIVDDSALIQGAKKSTRDGIPKWVAAGAIRLFVPLFALDHTTRAKEIKGRLANDATEALQWLDDATSKYPDFVILQGGFEQFETWAEVDRFAQPRTLFSEDDYLDLDGTADMSTKTSKMRIEHPSEDVGLSFSSNESYASESTAPSRQSVRSTSPLSPPTSPPKKQAQLADQLHTSTPGLLTSNETPVGARPLINYILWRINQESNPAEALDTFVFLSDNPIMRKHAQRFGVRSKTLAEIRYVIGRETQDIRNRHAVQQKGSSRNIATSTHGRNRSGDLRKSSAKPISETADREEVKSIPDTSVSDDDEILMKRAPKSPAALTKTPPRPRTITNNIHSPRDGRAGFGGQIRGSTRVAAHGGNRGGGAFSRGGRSASHATPTGPIDPDSFMRPTSSRGNGRGGRGLWMPT
ncbi:hypothetical protein CAC42_489 [Sphaceloma murrayae]|uniref:PIN domain-containing protein n=1 Tax=Sphaceloma murrayae TaxID=2082308 RepID=A0A2K1R3L7_9PEZI|nr:hypothetical protein CAC42_489 [Sphaceloma murrayae]